jgi:hypothetical protein
MDYQTAGFGIGTFTGEEERFSGRNDLGHKGLEINREKWM